MENAAKALMIGAGILMAVLIIGLLLYSYGSMSGYFEETYSEEQMQQLAAFNQQFEAYNRKLLRGTDVVSVMNKAIDNNTKYGPNQYNEPNYLIQVEFEMKEAMVYTKGESTSDLRFEVGSRYNIHSFQTIQNNKEAFTDFKRRIFDCKEVKYHETTGRVYYMRFEERKMQQEEYEFGFE